MKQTMIIAMLCIGMMCTAQTEVQKPTEIYKGINYLRLYENSNADSSSVYYTIQYRNGKYTHIVDIESISFSTTEDLIAFLDACMSTITEDKEYIHEMYFISKILGTATVFKSDNRSNFSLTKNQISKMKSSLETLIKH